MQLAISLLGPLHVTLDGATVAFRTDAQRALLAYLAAHQGTPIRRDALAALLSTDRNEQAARTYLRNRLTRLRAALHDPQAVPPWLIVDRKQVGLRRGTDVYVDLIVFQERLEKVERHAHRQRVGCPICLRHLEEAVALVRGEFLAGLHFPGEMWEAWVLQQREHFTQRALEAMTWLREAYTQRGAWEAAMGLAQRQLALEPWLEAAHATLMEARYHLGDRSGALAQYARCRSILAQELGVEPDESLDRLYRAIQAGDLSAPPAPQAAGNLPCLPEPLFGRAEEQSRLLQRLADPSTRLITLTGPGGIGKTHLAMAVGTQAEQSFSDGIWFVSLEGVQQDPGAVQATIAAALGVNRVDGAGIGQQVAAHLRTRQLLLILDNCETVLEHLIFLSRWLRQAPGLTILATSQEALGLQAETVLPLTGLPLGDDQPGPAEEMFARRAQQAWDAFTLTQQNLPHVQAICRLVEGLPLGIALAATWIRRRSPVQIVRALTESLDFLSTNLRDVPSRHRSIRAVLETSWAQLDPTQQGILARLSLFPGSFCLEAAAQVAGATLAHLDALCEKSLLQHDPARERYALHSLVRRFAAEKLGHHTHTTAQALVDYYRDFARRHGGDDSRLQPEWPNLAAAVDHAHALADHPTVLALVQALDAPWFRQIRLREMQSGLIRAVEAAEHLAQPSRQARLLLRLAEVEVELNEYAEAGARLARLLPALLRLEDGWGLAQAKYLLGRMHSEQTQDSEALALLEEARQGFEAQADRAGAARSLNLMAVSHLRLGKGDEAARDCLERSVALQRGLPPTSAYVEALRYLARIHMRAGALADAERLLAEAAQMARDLGDQGEEAAVLYEQMVLCKRAGQFRAAMTFGRAAQARFQTLGSLRWEGLVKTQLGLLHQAQGEPELALALVQEAQAIFAEIGDGFEEAYTHYYLYRLYAETGQEAQSLTAKWTAQRMGHALHIPYLCRVLDVSNAEAHSRP